MLNKVKRFFLGVLYPKNLFKNIFFQLTISIFVILSIFLIESRLVENVEEKYNYISGDSFFSPEYNDLNISDIEGFSKNSKFNKISSSEYLTPYLSNTYSYFSSRGTVSLPQSNKIISVSPTYCDEVTRIGSYELGSPVRVISENDSDGIYIHEELFKSLFGNKSIETECYLNFYLDMFNQKAYKLRIKGLYTYDTEGDFWNITKIFLPTRLVSLFISTGDLNSETNISGGIINVFNKDIDYSLNEAINKIDVTGTTKYKSISFEKDNYSKVFSLISFILLGTIIVMSTSIGFLEYNRIICRFSISKINVIYYKKKRKIIIDNLLNYTIIFLCATVTSFIIIILVELIYFILKRGVLQISVNSIKYIFLIFISGFIANAIGTYSNFFINNK